MPYTMRAIFVCPEAAMADANEWMMKIGESDFDDLTFRYAGYADATGNKYAVASGVIDAEWLDRIDGVLPRKTTKKARKPMVSRAEAMLDDWRFDRDTRDEPTASPTSAIMAVYLASVDHHAKIAAMGLTLIPVTL